MSEIYENANFNNPRKRKMLATKIISTLLYLFVTFWVTWAFVECLLTKDENGWAVLGYVIVWIYSGIGYAMQLLFSGICLIVSFVIKNDGVSRGTRIFFIILTALPVVTFGVFFLLTVICF